jgi:hypothetical protein
MECIEDIELEGRFKAHQLKQKESKTLADKILLATYERKMTWEWEGVEIENYIPSEEEMDEIQKLYTGFSNPKEKTTEEDILKLRQRASEVVAGYMIDESITPELLMSKQIGTSFTLSFINAVLDYEANVVREATALKNFRGKQRRA